MRIGRSVGAVLVGIVAGIVLSFGTETALTAAGVLPPLGQPMPDRLYLLVMLNSSVASIAGSYLTARLAPDRPMRHALTLGALGTIACIVGAAATWNKGPEFGPKWYPLSLVVLALPCSWAGGKLVKTN